MAVLQDKNSGSGGGVVDTDMVGAGVYPAVLLKVIDQFGVEREKFQRPGEYELKDESTFVFGVVENGENKVVATFPMTISASPNSNIYKFLEGYLGRAPQKGWDYAELEKTGAIIKVEVRSSRKTGNQYSVVTAAKPIKDEMGTDYSDRVPPFASFPAIPDPDPNANGAQSAPQATAPAQNTQVGIAQAPLPEASTFPDPFTGGTIDF